jgi:23S rRNA (guanosine2251-2'-O)-methyltransferase
MKEWILGRNPVYECLRAGRRHTFRLLLASGVEEKGRVVDILTLASGKKLNVQKVLRGQLDNLGDNHQGVALEASAYPYAEIADIFALAETRGEPLFVLVLDTMQNPQNLGTLMRTAEAVGVHGIVIPLARTVEVTPAVVSASAGASEHLLVAQSNLAQALMRFKEAGAWVIGLEGSPEAKPADQVSLTGPIVIVVGSEGEGIRSLVRSSCDHLLRLPMVGKIASLNAAVAGSVVLYLALEERQKAAKKITRE